MITFTELETTTSPPPQQHQELAAILADMDTTSNQIAEIVERLASEEEESELQSLMDAYVKAEARENQLIAFYTNTANGKGVL